MGRSVEALACATPVIDMELGKRQSGNLEKARPPDTVDPVVDTLPVPGIFLIGLQDTFDDRCDFGPTRWIVRDA